LNIILNTSCELPSVSSVSSAFWQLRPLTDLRHCLSVLQNMRTQVSQGHSTYTEAKSSTPPHLLHLLSTTLRTYLRSCWSSSEELVLTLGPVSDPATPSSGSIPDVPSLGSIPATMPSPGKKVPSQENLLAAFFNAIALAIRQKRGQDSQQCWLGLYSTHCMPGNVEGAGMFHCKPDLILVKTSDALTDTISWMSPKVIAEYTSQVWKPSIALMKTLHTKAYLVLLDQPWRQFVLALSIMKQDIRVHFYDCSGCSVSPAFNIHSNLHAFITILMAVMFGSQLCIGFDPTITVKPV